MRPLSPLAARVALSPKGRGKNFADGAWQLAGLAGAILEWRPGEFWAATPDELAAIFEALRGDEPPAPPDLRALMEAFPDG